MDERTPVHFEGYTTRTSGSVLSSGPNNEWSKTCTARRHRRPADLLVQVLGLQFLVISKASRLDRRPYLRDLRWNQTPVASAVWDGLKGMEFRGVLTHAVRI